MLRTSRYERTSRMLRNSRLLPFALGITVSALIFHLVATATSYWYNVNIVDHKFHAGLWKSCKGVLNVCKTIPFDTHAQFNAARFLAVLAAVTGAMCLGFICAYMFYRDTSLNLRLSGLFAILSAVIIAVSLICYVTFMTKQERHHIGWSVYMCTAGAATFVCDTVLIGLHASTGHQKVAYESSPLN